MTLHHHARGQRTSLDTKDIAVLAAGGSLAVLGIRRNDWVGAALTALGGSLLWSGLRSRAHFRHSPVAVIPAGEGIRVEETIVVDRPVALVYRFWRTLENLPLFMQHLVEVRQTGEGTSHWVAKGPAGMRVEWDAEIINELENELLAWQSLPDSDVENAGSVRFTPANNGAVTIVNVELKYNPPAGQLGAAVARLFREEPSQQIAQDLQQFKRIVEEPDFTTAELEVLQRYSRPTAEPQTAKDRSVKRANEVVQETSEESFPASDVPSWGPRRGI